MPLRVRVTLEMVHFDKRAVGGAPKSYAHYLRCRYEQVLNENSFRDAFVAQKREGHLPLMRCVHGRWAGHSGLVYRSRWCILMGTASVARPALFEVPVRTPYDCKKIPGRVFGRGQIVESRAAIRNFPLSALGRVSAERRAQYRPNELWSRSPSHACIPVIMASAQRHCL
jgi:hypothetical protein